MFKNIIKIIEESWSNFIFNLLLTSVLIFSVPTILHAEAEVMNDTSALQEKMKATLGDLKLDAENASETRAKVKASDVAVSQVDDSVSATARSGAESANENQIPVLSKVRSPQDVGSDSTWVRMLVGFSVLLGGFGFSVYAFRRWKRQIKTPFAANQIHILAQQSLGPRKSLAVIRVASESLLIGITETTITPLKSLSLLNDELPENSTPSRFEEAFDLEGEEENFVEV